MCFDTDTHVRKMDFTIIGMELVTDGTLGQGLAVLGHRKKVQGSNLGHVGSFSLPGHAHGEHGDLNCPCQV